MYCVKCGVELAASEKKCPLCGTTVYHPDFPRPSASGPYPPYEKASIENVKPSGILFILTGLFLTPFLLVLVCDLAINGGITWSGYAAGALLLVYVSGVLPLWFSHPNPVIFVPVDFVALGGYLLYINCVTGGRWFLSFAFPVTGGFMLIVTAVIALCYYLKRGYLYIFGGAFLVTGGFMLLMEFLLNITFHLHTTFTWSYYPLIVFSVMGAMLLTVALCPPLRDSMHKKFFL